MIASNTQIEINPEICLNLAGVLDTVTLNEELATRPEAALTQEVYLAVLRGRIAELFHKLTVTAGFYSS